MKYSMTNLREFEKLLGGMSSGEKAQVLKWVVQELNDSFPGIDSHPEVCGGQPCIVRTRIPVLCTFDPDFAGLARRIHDSIVAFAETADWLVRVNRPG
jgi:hypothetical protein